MDVHEGTTTVHEATLSYPEEEKDAYIEEVIELLELQPLADAIVISPNVEVRKRLTMSRHLHFAKR